MKSYSMLCEGPILPRDILIVTTTDAIWMFTGRSFLRTPKDRKHRDYIYSTLEDNKWHLMSACGGMKVWKWWRMWIHPSENPLDESVWITGVIESVEGEWDPI